MGKIQISLLSPKAKLNRKFQENKGCSRKGHELVYEGPTIGAT